ncbi:MAG: DUF937 domain-containing protein [Bryobacterales bacterium]|nr:DUF937 domain-containing protein [Acidobacteriota bacterium]MCB9384921.1 DUF937 domain-containing protein [Bryobacterales bacterium]
MNLLETILGASSGAPVRGLAQSFGLSENQASSALQALLPALSGGLKNNVASPGGLESLLGALAGGDHSQYLADPSRLGQASTVQDGNAILGHLLGSKDVSRQVASNASSQTGLPVDMLKKMLPVVATLAMGALAKNTADKGIQRSSAAAMPGGDLMSMLGPMLDADGDGSIADDLLGLAGKFFSR